MKTKSPEPKPGKSDVTRKVSPRNRIKYSTQQLQRLEKVFMFSQYPDSSILEDLSNTLNIDTERLSTWFQNRRSKFKRQAKGSHVTWMRQQLYDQGEPPSRDSKIQPGNKCHVLSPPVATSSRKDDVISKPKSNLHYLPNTSCSREVEYDAAYSPMTSLFTYPSTPSIYSALSDAVPAPDHAIPHSASEMSFLQPPLYFPTQAGNANSTNFTSAGTYSGSSFCPSYLPSYNFPNAQLTFPQI